MHRDATLDEFTTAYRGEAEPTPSDDTEVVTVEPTMAWTPESVKCSQCGTQADRLWFDDGARVCPDCKPW